MSKFNTFRSNVAFAFRNIWKWKKSFFAIASYSAIWSVCGEFFSIWMISEMIDLITQKNHSVFVFIIVFFAALFLLEYAQTFLTQKKIIITSILRNRYIKLLFDKILKTDYENVENPERLNDYCVALQNASRECAPVAMVSDLFSIFSAIAGVVVFGSVISSISVVVVFSVIIYAFFTFFAGIILNEITQKDQSMNVRTDRKEQYFSSVFADPSFAKEIRLFDMKTFLMPEIMAVQLLQYIRVKKLERKKLLLSFGTLFISWIQEIVMYYCVFSYILSGHISPGEFLLYIASVSSFSGKIVVILQQIVSLNLHNTQLTYYMRYLTMKDKHCADLITPKSVLSASVSVEFQNVCFQYPGSETDTLHNISFTIKPEETIALVGINGAGKTTLVKLLCGLYVPTSGAVFINGVKTDAINIGDYYDIFSPVFQDIHLLPVTIKEFIISDFGKKNDEMAADDKKLTDALIKVGLYDKVSSLPQGVNSHLMKGIYDDAIELSGGETQKLMIARAIYKDSPFVILDEPTAALDPLAEKELYQEYREIFKGKSVLFISHRMASTRFCDRIMLLNNGDIAESGTHDELLEKNGLYAELYNAQKQYYL